LRYPDRTGRNGTESHGAALCFTYNVTRTNEKRKSRRGASAAFHRVPAIAPGGSQPRPYRAVENNEACECWQPLQRLRMRCGKFIDVDDLSRVERRGAHTRVKPLSLARACLPHFEPFVGRSDVAGKQEARCLALAGASFDGPGASSGAADQLAARCQSAGLEKRAQRGYAQAPAEGANVLWGCCCLGAR
jgi:hypothetical protein